MRFNPPPGWPVSPGWEPYPGFAPEPSWPPAPAGWQFWIDDSAAATVHTVPYHDAALAPGVAPPQGIPPYPGMGPPHPGPLPWQPGGGVGVGPSRNRTRTILIALGLGLTLVIALVVAVLVGFGGDSKSGSGGSPSSAASADDQIRAVVADLESAWNNTDYDAFIKHTCRTFASDSSHSEKSFTRDRSQNGEATLKVTSIKVKGDSADVTVDRKYADQPKARPATLDFVKEDGEWKMCPH
jgi:hypothetical protein